MLYNPQKHHRRSIRLKGYDYAKPGAYFVTICTQDRSNVFGEIIDGEMHLSSIGQIAHNFWPLVSEHFRNVKISRFIVMPNHVHAIITIHEPIPDTVSTPAIGRGVVSTPDDSVSAPATGRGVVSTPADAVSTTERGRETLPLPNLGQIVAYYKYQTTKQVNQQNNNPGVRLWQRNYYEQIVRSEEELHRFTNYILSNPQRWSSDILNPSLPSNQLGQEPYKSV